MKVQCTLPVKGNDLCKIDIIKIKVLKKWIDRKFACCLPIGRVLDKMLVKHAQWSAFDRYGDPSNWHICGLLRAPKCRCRNNSWSHPPFLTPSSFLPPCLPISCPESDEVWGREPERIIGPKSAKFLHKHCKRTAVNSHFELNTWSDGEYWA